MSAVIIDFKTRRILNAKEPDDATFEQRAAHIDSYLEVVRDHLLGIEEEVPGEYRTSKPILIVPHANGRQSMVFEPCDLERDVFVASMKYAFTRYDIEMPIPICDNPSHAPHEPPDDIA